MAAARLQVGPVDAGVDDRKIDSSAGQAGLRERVDGRRGDDRSDIADPSTATGSKQGYADDPGDLPYEPPRAAPAGFDPGPPASFARLLLGREQGFEWPDFASLGVTSHPSFGVGPIYRGRFNQLSLVVLADQTSEDDVFAAHALSGEAGQWFQGFLGAAGLTKRYLIIRTLPVDGLDLTAAQRLTLVDHPKVRALHRELLTRVRTANAGLAAILALGPSARRLAPNVAPAGLAVVDVAGYGEPGWQSSWQAALTNLAARTYAKDLPAPTFALSGGRTQLPRIDLPYGTPRWVGTSGDRGVRPNDLDLGRPSPDYLKLFLPSWIASLGPAPLSPAEQAAADQLP